MIAARQSSLQRSSKLISGVPSVQTLTSTTKLVKAHRTIPINLEDWLHSFRSSLESHPFPKETVGCSEKGEDQPRGLDTWANAPERLFPAMVSDNVLLSFAV